MILLLVLLFLVICLLGLIFKATSSLLSTLIWLCIKIPFAIVTCVVGVVFCCTILLIPLGILSIKAGLRMMMPARAF